MSNIVKKSIIILATVFVIVPTCVYGQLYIIGDIPDTGDDGLQPKISASDTLGNNQQVIEDVIITDTVTTVTETVDVIVTETITQNKKTLQTVGIVGTVSGAAMAVATTTVPLFATTPTMIQDLMFLNFFGIFVKRRNKKRWGIVFDVDTKLPIPAAKVTLFDNSLKELETTYSDKNGRFGFLAGEGVYKLDVYKKNYEAVTESGVDRVYGNLYTGGEVDISGEKVLSENIALHSLAVDWKKYADKKIAAYTSTWALVKKYLFTTFYFVGLIATIVITIFYPSIFNIVLVIINILFFISIYFYKKKDHGTVMTSNNKPVPFAVVNLYDEEGRKDAFAVTDVIGRYYMLADNGSYTIKTTGQSVGGKKEEKSNDVHVRNQIVNEDIVFE